MATILGEAAKIEPSAREAGKAMHKSQQLDEPSQHEMCACVDWFEAGEVIYLTANDHDRFFPTADTNPHDRRMWLAGFASAWASVDDERTVRQALADRLCNRQHLLALFRNRLH